MAAFIYTSGTTGAPKAAKVKHHRLFRAGLVWGGIAFRFQADDVLYIPLPLYHGNAMILGTSSAITYGVTIALARKFSASAFWDDYRRYRATHFLYIGELCRYLNNAPRLPSDRDHSVRAISGNGLRPDIWESFQGRFGIERIAEFYGATEGNVITINVGKTAGSVGKMLPGHALARWDPTREDFVRGANGRLVRCWPGEVGVLLGEISDTAAFDGYEDQTATERKIVRGAFRPADAWFNTGDLLRADWLRNLYFADRLGDTFRWKGENVSTFEVQEQISAWPPVREVNVYGVAVEGMEGRAGMASLVLAEGEAFDAASFKAHVDSVLPKSARPVFVRIDATLEVTGTLKIKKRDLQEQGADPAKIKSPLFVRHPASDEYVPLGAGLYEDLKAGRVRLLDLSAVRVPVPVPVPGHGHAYGRGNVGTAPGATGPTKSASESLPKDRARGQWPETSIFWVGLPSRKMSGSVAKMSTAVARNVSPNESTAACWFTSPSSIIRARCLAVARSSPLAWRPAIIPERRPSRVRFPATSFSTSTVRCHSFLRARSVVSSATPMLPPSWRVRL